MPFGLVAPTFAFVPVYVHSPASIGTDQERFRFAKAVVDLRKQTRGGVEETVVLAFGGGHGSAVHVTRKMKKRALFKVG